MKITTWNVNSIRSRLERVHAWLERRRPDVLCLQETKVVDEEFPREGFTERGYRVEAFGQKTYNGVALLAREDPRDVTRGFGDDPEADRRLIAARVGDVAVVCVYVPNGQSPDSPKFAYKLAWFERLGRFLETWGTPEEALYVVGDFNVAPEDRDVHDPEAWRGQVLFHPKEHEALAALCGWGLRDVLRDHEARAGLYTWWDYRRLAFPRNAGLRIDLALGTPPAAARCTGVHIDRDERKGQKPSDHVPVTVFLDEPPSFD